MADGHVADKLVEKQSGTGIFVVGTWSIYGPRTADNILSLNKSDKFPESSGLLQVVRANFPEVEYIKNL